MILLCLTFNFSLDDNDVGHYVHKHIHASKTGNLVLPIRDSTLCSYFFTSEIKTVLYLFASSEKEYDSNKKD